MNDWICVCLNDEMYFEYDSQNWMHIILKPDQRYCKNCIQRQNIVKKKNFERQHYWTAIEYDFKFPTYFYEMPENINDKMNQQIYINQIFDFIIKFWINIHSWFVLKKWKFWTWF